jgi:hypothetical protein
MTEKLVIWTVYDNPLDMPGFFVARAHIVEDGFSSPTAAMFIGLSLAEVRRQLPPGLFCMPRQDGDEPHIVESWL